MIAIDKKVPMPKEPPRNQRKYPLPSMKIGDSFLVSDYGNEGSFRATILTGAKRLGIRVTARKFEDGIRVWRIA